MQQLQFSLLHTHTHTPRASPPTHDLKPWKSQVDPFIQLPQDFWKASTVSEIFNKPTLLPIHRSILSIVEKLMVILRDGRKLIGILRSFDQFGMSKAHVYTIRKEASKLIDTWV